LSAESVFAVRPVVHGPGMRDVIGVLEHRSGEINHAATMTAENATTRVVQGSAQERFSWTPSPVREPPRTSIRMQPPAVGTPGRTSVAVLNTCLRDQCRMLAAGEAMSVNSWTRGDHESSEPRVRRRHHTRNPAPICVFSATPASMECTPLNASGFHSLKRRIPCQTKIIRCRRTSKNPAAPHPVAARVAAAAAAAAVSRPARPVAAAVLKPLKRDAAESCQAAGTTG